MRFYDNLEFLIGIYNSCNRSVDVNKVIIYKGTYIVHPNFLATLLRSGARGVIQISKEKFLAACIHALNFIEQALIVQSYFKMVVSNGNALRNDKAH